MRTVLGRAAPDARKHPATGGRIVDDHEGPRLHEGSVVDDPGGKRQETAPRGVHEGYYGPDGLRPAGETPRRPGRGTCEALQCRRRGAPRVLRLPSADLKGRIGPTDGAHASCQPSRAPRARPLIEPVRVGTTTGGHPPAKCTHLSGDRWAPTSLPQVGESQVGESCNYQF
ncbi:unnamed protein product [Amoebophrya sp. A120]|nr:unnamed protein product [Amoebophrya sp. A120]|eukprot:GSA120T00002012001.1